MTTFDDRRDQFEKKYVHEEELLFKARARRNKLFGKQIASKLNKTDVEAADYAKQFVMAAALVSGGDDALIDLAIKDIQTAGQTVSAEDLKRLLVELQKQALHEIKTE